MFIKCLKRTKNNEKSKEEQYEENSIMTKMTKNTKKISTPFCSSQARHIMQDAIARAI